MCLPRFSPGRKTRKPDNQKSGKPEDWKDGEPESQRKNYDLRNRDNQNPQSAIHNSKCREILAKVKKFYADNRYRDIIPT